MLNELLEGEKSPYQRGFDAGMEGKPGPAFSTPDTPWAARLYERGWSAGTDARLAQPSNAELRPRAEGESRLE